MPEGQSLHPGRKTTLRPANHPGVLVAKGRTPMLHRPLLLAAILASSLVATPALADVSDVDRATARALTLEGYEALDRKDYATAADRFGRADSLFHVPTVALGLAHAEVGLGKLVSALATYSRIVREGAPAHSPPAFAKAVEDARREIEVLMARIPSVVIEVRGAKDAKVTIDGVEVPAAALGVKRLVDPGAHVIRATSPTSVPREITMTLLERKTETVTLELEPNKALPPPAAAPPLSASPPSPPVAPPPSVPVDAPSNGGTQRTLGVVALGVAGAGLVLGGVTGGMALGKHASLVDQCPEGRCFASQRASLQSDVDAYHTLGAASTAGFVIGGAALATGVILLVTAPKAKREARVTPLIGAGFAGARGRF